MRPSHERMQGAKSTTCREWNPLERIRRGRAPHSPLQAGGTKKLVPVNKRIVFGRVELGNTRFAEVLELDLAAHKLAHVVFKGFGTECDFGRKRMHASWRASQDTGTCWRRRVKEWAGRTRNGRALKASRSMGRAMTSSGSSVDINRLPAKGRSNMDGIVGGGVGACRRRSRDRCSDNIIGYLRLVGWLRRVNH